MERAERVASTERAGPPDVEMFRSGGHAVRGRDFTCSTTRCGSRDDFAILVERRRQGRLAFAPTTHAVLAHESPRSIVETIR